MSDLVQCKTNKWLNKENQGFAQAPDSKVAKRIEKFEKNRKDSKNLT